MISEKISTLSLNYLNTIKGIKNYLLGAEQMSQRLRVLIALPEDQGSILSTHMWVKYPYK